MLVCLVLTVFISKTPHRLRMVFGRHGNFFLRKMSFHATGRKAVFVYISDVMYRPRGFMILL